MKRTIENNLDQWVRNSRRKVLLLRGARQVGKTYSIRALGKKFGHYLEVNFESDKSVHHFFQSDLNPDEICANLSAYYNIPVIDGETLLFLDEIQSCIPAISSLRFFHEKRPDLHVVAAGSLLEFAMKELPSFGVGRIQFLFMYPLSFAEFLIANQEQHLHEMVLNSNPLKAMNEVFHKKMLGYLKKFLFTGGLPEVVETFLSTSDLRKAQTVLDRLILGFDDDFAKYKKHVPVYRLKEVFQAVAAQSGNQFSFSRTSENMSVEQVKISLNLLEMAGLVYKVKHTNANGIPLGAGVNPKKFKVIMFDHGLFQRALGLDLSQHLLADDFEAINKGYHAEQFAGTELIKYSDPQLKAQLYYWHREKSGSTAEVDYVIQKSDRIIPIEVKSGTQGKMQSLWMFMKEKKPELGIRISLENFSHYQSIEVYPLYAIGNICKEKSPPSEVKV